MTIRIRVLALLLALCGAAAASDHDGTHRFYGYAYDLQSNRYLYTEVHEQTIENGRWARGNIHTYDADGQLIGTKTLDFSANPYIPQYRFELPGQQYLEAITDVTADAVRMTRQVGGRARSKTLAPGPATAADSGFHAYLVAHFDQLQAGRTLEFQFMVAGNLASYRFRARRVGQAPFEGRPAVQIRLECDSLLRLVAPALNLTYDPDTRMLLEYRGISNIHDPATGKAYNARIVFPSRPPADAPKTLPLLADGSGP